MVPVEYEGEPPKQPPNTKKGNVTAKADIQPSTEEYTFDLTDGSEQQGDRAQDAAARNAALNRCFDALDKDQSGYIDLKEFKQYLFKSGVTLLNVANGAQDLLAKMDVNKDNQVCRVEFVTMMEAITVDKSDDDLEAWVAEMIYTATSKTVTGFGNSLGEILGQMDLNPEQMAKLKLCFSALDKDGSGYVEMTELKLYLSQTGVNLEDAQSEEVSTLMSKLDKNADGKVSEQEFYVTLATVRKAVLTDTKFNELVDNILKACNGRQVDKPALAEVLLGKDKKDDHGTKQKDSKNPTEHEEQHEDSQNKHQIDIDQTQEGNGNNESDVRAQ